MIRSHSRTENFLVYLLMEILMAAIITFLGTAIIVFYGVGKSDTRRNTQNLESLFDSPIIYLLICVIPAIIVVITLLYFRNRNYIVGYLFDNDKRILLLEYRGLRKKLMKVSYHFDEIIITPFQEKKIIMNQPSKGLSILLRKDQLSLDFISNNFIWEKQPREVANFLREINNLNK